MDEDLTSIGLALARIPSGCSILTVEHEGRTTGVLVSWVQQAAMEPPMITVCLKRGRSVVSLVEGSGRFLLNIIGEDSALLFKHFGKGFARGEDAFTGLAIEETPFGPKLGDAIAHLGCRIAKKVAVGDHDLYVAEAVAGAAVETTKPHVHIRKNGLSY